jgi:RNA-dependent RNA polymerase
MSLCFLASKSSLTVWNKAVLNYIVDRGERALASCLGGGDLDGDTFNLILDVRPNFYCVPSCLRTPQPRLLPTKLFKPGEYTAATIKTTLTACNISDVVNFVIDYVSRNQSSESL